MKSYKKTFVGTIIAFFIGTSCCWLSSLAIWIGGVSVIGVVSNFIEDLQLLFIGIGIILLLCTIYFFLRKRRVK